MPDLTMVAGYNPETAESQRKRIMTQSSWKPETSVAWTWGYALVMAEVRFLNRGHRQEVRHGAQTGVYTVRDLP